MATRKARSFNSSFGSPQVFSRSDTIAANVIQSSGIVDPFNQTGSETRLYVVLEARSAPTAKDGFLYVFDGTTWVTRNQGGFTPYPLRTVPGSPAIVFAVFVNAATFANTVKKSTDYGATWTDLGLPPFGDGLRTIECGADGYCYVSGHGFNAAGSGVYKSNGGAWTQAIAGIDDGTGYFGAPAALAFSNDTIVFHSTTVAYRLKESEGTPVALTHPNSALPLVTIIPGKNGTWVALVDGGGGAAGSLYRSTNQGASWTLGTSHLDIGSKDQSGSKWVGQDARSPTTWWHAASTDPTAHPTDSKIHLWKSTDDGASWADQGVTAFAVDTGVPYRTCPLIWVAA